MSSTGRKHLIGCSDPGALDTIPGACDPADAAGGAQGPAQGVGCAQGGDCAGDPAEPAGIGAPGRGMGEEMDCLLYTSPSPRD